MQRYEKKNLYGKRTDFTLNETAETMPGLFRNLSYSEPFCILHQSFFIFKMPRYYSEAF